MLFFPPSLFDYFSASLFELFAQKVLVYHFIFYSLAIEIESNTGYEAI